MPFRQAQGSEPAEGFKDMSPSKGKMRSEKCKMQNAKWICGALPEIGRFFWGTGFLRGRAAGWARAFGEASESK